MGKRRARRLGWSRSGWPSARAALLCSALVLTVCGVVLAYTSASGPASETPGGGATLVVSACSSHKCVPAERSARLTNRRAVYTNRGAVYVELPAAAATTQVGTPVSITATVKEGTPSVPQSGKLVTFTVTGANPGGFSSVSNAAGQASFTYTGKNTGTDRIVASFVNKAGETVKSNEVTEIWVAAGGVLGSKQGSKQAVSPSPSPSPGKHLAAPVLGQTVNVEVVSGVVFVKPPAGVQLALAARSRSAFESRAKGIGFVPLREARQIPVGSTLDTTEGVAKLTTATATPGKTQFGDFGAGIFTILQSRAQRGLTNLKIVNVLSSRQVCARLGKKAQAAKRRLSKKVLGFLKGTASGKFTTSGQYSAATVRGTIWSVTNRCDGTLTQVTRGVVSVRDFARRKTITLRAGQRYLAKAP
jgi:hypothetical protein